MATAQSRRSHQIQEAQREPRAPVYLAPAEEAWVGLDGPALRISQLRSADRLLPLTRIARVLSSPRVDWEHAALMACAESGVPVVFMDDGGRVIARLLGRPGQRDELRDRLVGLLLRPEGLGMLRHWIDRSRQRAARWAAIKLSWRPTTERAAEIRNWVNRAATALAGREPAENSRQWLRTLTYAWMEGHLTDLGFGASLELGQIDQPALAAEFTDVLFWYLEPARIGWLMRRSMAAKRKGKPLLAPSYREAVRLFESGNIRVATRGREITNCLHRWLIHET